MVKTITRARLHEAVSKANTNKKSREPAGSAQMMSRASPMSRIEPDKKDRADVGVKRRLHTTESASGAAAEPVKIKKIDSGRTGSKSAFSKMKPSTMSVKERQKSKEEQHKRDQTQNLDRIGEDSKNEREWSSKELVELMDAIRAESQGTPTLTSNPTWSSQDEYLTKLVSRLKLSKCKMMGLNNAAVCAKLDRLCKEHGTTEEGFSNCDDMIVRSTPPLFSAKFKIALSCFA